MPDKKLTDVTDNNVGKMNDNEIVKALECCGNQLDCVGCECVENCPQDINELNGLALDLINRLQAEVERLKNDKVHIASDNAYFQSVIQSLEAQAKKHIPKKVNILLKGTTGWNTKCHCPNCSAFISNGKYCSECGQALDWGK